jgi:hypothetical protein
MSLPFPKLIRIEHSLPGRVRLRLPWLHDERVIGEPVADRLSALAGMKEVRVRMFTGSVLCIFDPAQLDEARIIEEIKDHTHVDAVLRRDEPLPHELRKKLRPDREANRIARAAERFFAGVNEDVLEASEGRLDLGTLTSVTFATVGAAEIATMRDLPFPPWFQLAWWAFRTFTIVKH